MRQPLRPYQLDAIEAVRSAVRSGRRRILLVAPTGSGKTTISSEIIHSAVAKGSRCYFLAHRKELIEQCSERLKQWDVKHGIVRADDRRWQPTEQVQVCSIPSLANRIESGLIAPDAKLLVVDEAHRSMSPTYRKLIEAHTEAGAVTLGLTATPIRKDGKGLGEIYDAIVQVSSPKRLIADGYLLEPRIYAEADPDLSGVTTAGGDYTEAGLGEAMDKPTLIANVPRHMLEHIGRGKRSVVFACTVAHSKHLADELNAAGIRAEHIDGNTSMERRDAVLAALRSGELEAVTNCAVLTEGWDLPELDAAVLVRPTKSLGLYLQMVGRVLRTSPGKKEAIVLDHGGCVRRLGWPTVDREWALDAGDKADDAVVAIKQCPGCAAMLPRATRECPQCGHDFTVPHEGGRELPEVIEAKMAELKEHDLAAKEAEKASDLDGWMRTAASKGLKPGWVSYRYREEYGAWPPKAEMRAAEERLPQYLRATWQDRIDRRAQAKAQGFGDTDEADRFARAVGEE